MKTEVLNHKARKAGKHVEAVIYAYEKGFNTGYSDAMRNAAASAGAMKEAADAIKMLDARVTELTAERDTLTKRIDELTSKEWDNVQAVCAKLYPDRETLRSRVYEAIVKADYNNDLGHHEIDHMTDAIMAVIPQIEDHGKPAKLIIPDGGKYSNKVYI